MVQSSPQCGLVAFRILQGDTEQIDRTTWVYRRPASWANRTFGAFTFIGGAFCARAEVFWRNGGFWDVLTYSREEEDLGFALLDAGLRMLYCPAITIRHYSDLRGRASIARRKRVELKNGLLVLWRRIPLPLAMIACGARIVSMLCAALARRCGVVELLRAVPEAIRTWRAGRLVRSPISMSAAWRYVSLHFTGSL
jgi:GT2 family glycosyltransferase